MSRTLCTSQLTYSGGRTPPRLCDRPADHHGAHDDGEVQWSDVDIVSVPTVTTPQTPQFNGPQPVKWGALPIVNESASAPGVPLPTGTYLVPLCPRDDCGERLYPMPQPNAERLSHICWNGHKWRDDA